MHTHMLMDYSTPVAVGGSITRSIEVIMMKDALNVFGM
jgi:hypothetical protein